MTSVTEKELAFLFPEESVEIAGHAFTLRPFSFHETFLVAEHLRSVLHLLQVGMSIEAIAGVIVQARDGIEQTMSLALGLDVEVIRKFDNRSAMKAIVEIIRINKDFFAQQVQEELRSLNGLLENKGDK